MKVSPCTTAVEKLYEGKDFVNWPEGIYRKTTDYNYVIIKLNNTALSYQMNELQVITALGCQYRKINAEICFEIRMK